MTENALDREMRKLKAMGVTISTTPAAAHRDGFEDRPFGLIQAAAERHGIAENPKPRVQPAARDLGTGPDCREGKHRACDGRGFDLVADLVIDCACACHEKGAAA